jgi:hypothetical protein
VEAFCLLSFTIWANGKGDGNEISFRCFIFNVCSGISVCLYVGCKYLNVGSSLVTISEWNF